MHRPRLQGDRPLSATWFGAGLDRQSTILASTQFGEIPVGVALCTLPLMILPKQR